MTLKPVCAEILELYTKWTSTEFDFRFSKLYCAELRRLLGSAEAVSLVETAVTIGNCGDIEDLAAMRKTVSKILRQRGVRLPRGKRTDPRLEKIVDRLVPLLLSFGLPLASSENSKIVKALRLVASALNVPGDPRDVLRREIRIDREASLRARSIVFEAVAKGFAPDLVYKLNE